MCQCVNVNAPMMSTNLHRTDQSAAHVTMLLLYLVLLPAAQGYRTQTSNGRHSFLGYLDQRRSFDSCVDRWTNVTAAFYGPEPTIRQVVAVNCNIERGEVNRVHLTEFTKEVREKMENVLQLKQLGDNF